ncbi:hypothetical protein R6Q59_010400 [Mikania micrantha]
MEEICEDLKKHMCRFCKKTFSCGRSLGGHMRSHVINSTDHHHRHHQVKNTTCLSVVDKICKECGKGFQSWKALFGHMKCHSVKHLNSKNKKISSLNQHSEKEDPDSKNHFIMRSRSRSRSRRNKWYKVTTASSSINMNVNCNQINSNNASTSMMSEIEQEQEAEVAVSLMMLSRDLGRCGNEFLSSDYCYKSSVLFNLSEVEGKDSMGNCSKMNEFSETKVGFDFLGRSETKINKFGSSLGEVKDSNKREFEHDQTLCGHKASHQQLKRELDSRIQHKYRNEHKPVLDHDETINGYDSRTYRNKHKPVLDHDETINGYDSRTSTDHQESSSFNLDVGSLKRKVVLRSHVCPICFKTFTSGQALGGHKRSHLISEAKQNQENKTIVVKKPDEQVRDTRVFLDLNMLPDEEEQEMIMSSSTTDEYKSYCWDDNSNHHSHESTILCLLSTR